MTLAILSEPTRPVGGTPSEPSVGSETFQPEAVSAVPSKSFSAESAVTVTSRLLILTYVSVVTSPETSPTFTVALTLIG